MACRRHVTETKSRAEAYKRVPRLSVVRFGAADIVTNRSNKRRSLCVPLSRVASGRLGLYLIGCDLNQPSRWLRVLLAVPSGRAVRSVLHEDLGRRGEWRLIAT